MGYNKFVVGTTTKLDLSGDTATASDVVSGKTFHDKNGDPQTGTYEPTPDWTAIFNIKTQNPNLYGRTVTITKIS